MSRFEKFMVHVDIGTDEKLAHLTDAERLCHIAGVLAIAAKSPIRGRLLVGECEAGPVPIARRAGVTPKVAASTLAKLIEVGVLTRDAEYDCWRVHNWEIFNPEPKADPTNAERQARYKARRRAGNTAGNATGNGAVTPPRGRASAIACARSPEGKEVEVEEPPNPQRGKRAADGVEAQAIALGFDEWLADHHAVTGKTIPREGTKTRVVLAGQFVACCKEVPAPPLPLLKLATRGAHADPHRRERGYDGAENVLRPTKILNLVDNGRRLANGQLGDRPPKLADLLAAQAAHENRKRRDAA